MHENPLQLYPLLRVDDKYLLKNRNQFGHFFLGNRLVLLDRRACCQLFCQIVLIRAPDLNIIQQVHPLEGVVREQHVKKYHTQGPDVYLLVIRLSSQNLRGHEVGSAAVGLCGFLDGLAEPEVADFAREALVLFLFE